MQEEVRLPIPDDLLALYFVYVLSIVSAVDVSQIISNDTIFFQFRQILYSSIVKSNTWFECCELMIVLLAMKDKSRNTIQSVR